VALYLSTRRIAEALDRAGNSRAKGGMLDFLLVKRTFTAKGESSAAIIQSEQAYMGALDELARCHANDARNPYINIFSITNSAKGYLNPRYYSNGTGSTISNNPWNPVIELSSGKPRRASLRAGYEANLETLLLKANPREEKPNLDEVAIWYHRYDDIESVVSGASTDEARLQALRAHFVSDLGLTPTEIGHLFDTAQAPIDASAFVDQQADPATYLPKVAGNLAVTPAAVTGSCSLDLVVALAAKPFVILTGPSGTGKSRAGLKLAQGIERFVGDKVKGDIYQLVPVGPDWTTPKRLLGFRTPFGETRKMNGTETNDSYEVTETLRLILRACHPSATGIPYFLIFDEMNLSHVERYFSTFLSLMEATNILDDEDDADRLVDPQSLETISDVLHAKDPTAPEAESAKLLVDNGQSLRLPSNLFFIGTVNVDETTYMFSPKVLDRAHVIEIDSQKPALYLRASGVEEPGGSIEAAKANELLRSGIDDREGQRHEVPNPSTILDRLEAEAGFEASEVSAIRDGVITALDGCYELLLPVGFPFGYRTAKEVFVYVYVWIKSRQLIGSDKAALLAGWPDALDKAVLQKVLPKIHGSKRVLGDSLKATAAFVSGGHAGSTPAARYTLGFGAPVEIPPAAALTLPGGQKLALSAKKLEAMHARLSATGYVSFVS
jgi:hypothetical protein